MTGNTRKLLVPLATMAVAAAVTVGSGANWTSSTSIDSHVNGGSILIEDNDGGFTLNISKLQPGQSKSGSVTVHNTGDLIADLTVTETDGTATKPFDAGVLTLRIQQTYEGTTTTLYGPGAFGGMANTPQALSSLSGNTSTATTDEVTITFTVALDANAGNANQGADAVASYSFDSTVHTGQSPTSSWPG